MRDFAAHYSSPIPSQTSNSKVVQTQQAVSTQRVFNLRPPKGRVECMCGQDGFQDFSARSPTIR